MKQFAAIIVCLAMIDLVGPTIDKTVVYGSRGAYTVPGRPGQGTTYIYSERPCSQPRGMQRYPEPDRRGKDKRRKP